MRGPTILALPLLGACGLLTPPHVRPAPPTPPVYPAAYAGDTTRGARASQVGWRDFFVDPRLDTLLATALTYNRDLAVSVERVEEARGAFHIQRAERLPTVDVTGSGTRTKAGSAGIAGIAPSASPGTFDRYALGVGVSAFELDFWGRVRSQSEAALAQFLATAQAERAFRLSLIREVASTYLAALEATERIRLAEATVASRREGLQIARVRLEAGITSELDYRQAESLLTQAETELAGLRLTRARSENALAVLVGGRVPATLPAPLPLARQASPVALAAGLPSELLVARPDVLAAEEQLRAARADVGAARAAFFPSITLTGSYGYVSTELQGLLGADGRTWSFGPSINLPIFDFGRRLGNLDVTAARENIAIASYERTVQTAFQEVADALAGRRFLAEQVAAQERGVRAQRQIATLARTRYDEGVVSFLEVLDAERNLFAAEQALLQLRRAEADNLVALYVALGGGALERR